MARKLTWTGATLIAGISVQLVLLVWLILGWNPAPDAPGHQQLAGLSASPRGGDFVLDSPDGPLSLSELRGKLVLIYFGYTWCPDICPTNLAILTQVLRALDAQERAQVQVLFISVDPGRDTPERLRQYTGYFHPDIIPLSGQPEQLAEIGARYGAAWRRVEQPDSAMGYVVDHSADTLVVDQQGQLADHIAHATPPEQIVALIRTYLSAESQ